jgi:phenylpyruvate tautomerase PptA (4-oxalocrotonate tautomerase family)
VARYLIQVPCDVAAHQEITGDDADSVQVAITEIDAGCFFAGGRLIECDHIFVHGYLAGGATVERKEALIAKLSADVTKAADFDLDSTWVTISPL